MSDDTTPAIGYDELLAAHREAIRQRDQARGIAVHLEQELAETLRQLDEARGAYQGLHLRHVVMDAP